MGHAGGECAYAQLTDLANDLRRRRPLANSSDSSPIFQGLDTCMQSSPNKVIGKHAFGLGYRFKNFWADRVHIHLCIERTRRRS